MFRYIYWLLLYKFTQVLLEGIAMFAGKHNETLQLCNLSEQYGEVSVVLRTGIPDRGHRESRIPSTRSPRREPR